MKELSKDERKAIYEKLYLDVDNPYDDTYHHHDCFYICWKLKREVSGAENVFSDKDEFHSTMEMFQMFPEFNISYNEMLKTYNSGDEDILYHADRATVLSNAIKLCNQTTESK